MLDYLYRFRDQFTESGFWERLRQFFQRIGLQGVYTALLLFYAYKRKETPSWAKRIVIGALGYMIAPIDLMPDLSPLLGFTDDIGILSLALVTIAGNVDMQTKISARRSLKHIFGPFDLKQIAGVDKQL